MCISLNCSEGLDIVSYALHEKPLSQNVSLSESMLYVCNLSWHEFSNCICKSVNAHLQGIGKKPTGVDCSSYAHSDFLCPVGFGQLKTKF